MNVLDDLFGPQVRDLQRAMTRTTQRHALLTANLANVNTPGYKRKDLDFGITLEEEMRSPHRTFRGLPQAQEQQTSVRLDGNSVDLEREVMAIAETELHYQALTDMANAYFSNLKNVIKEGR